MWEETRDFFAVKHRKLTQQCIIVALMYIGNIAYTFGAEVDIVVTAMREQTSWWTEQDSGLLIAFSSGFYAVGTFAMGIIADRVGGRLTFIVALILSGLLNMATAWGQSATYILVVQALNIVIGAAAWSSMTNIISYWFQAGSLAMVFSIISTSDELGEFLVDIIEGSLLDAGIIAWYGMFLVQGAFCVVVAILLAFTLRGAPKDGEFDEQPAAVAAIPPHLSADYEDDESTGSRFLSSSFSSSASFLDDGLSSEEKAFFTKKSINDDLENQDHAHPQQHQDYLHQNDDRDDNHDHDDDDEREKKEEGEEGGKGEDEEASWRACCAKFITQWHFWQILGVVLCLTIISEFEDWFPTFYQTVFSVSAGKASKAASWVGLGATLALVGGIFYDRLNWKADLLVMMFFNLTTMGCLIVLFVYVQAGGDDLSVAAVFGGIYGLVSALPYYLPSAIYAVKFGGHHFSGTLYGFFDAIGYGPGIGLDIWAGFVVTPEGWTQIVAFLILLALIATVLLACYQWITRPLPAKKTPNTPSSDPHQKISF